MIITKSGPFTKYEIEKRNKLALSSLSMDLARVSMGYKRGSKRLAERFWQEALKRRQEVDTTIIKPYLKKLLDEFPSMMNKKEADIAEDALMYSTLFQNAAIKYS